MVYIANRRKYVGIFHTTLIGILTLTYLNVAIRQLIFDNADSNCCPPGPSSSVPHRMHYPENELLSK